MTVRPRLFLSVFSLVAVAALGIAGPTSAAEPTPASALGSATEDPSSPIGGIEFRYLPPGLGVASDTEYSYDEVDFASRIWESGSNADGWSVDLHVTVMRGWQLADGTALHDWFVDYQQRPPAAARYRPVLVHGRPGWLSDDQLFWLVRPGLATSVTIDRSQWGWWELILTGWSASTAR